MLDELLFGNHLSFLAAHRGKVGRRKDCVMFDGDAPFLSFWVPFGEAAQVPSDVRQVRLAPGSGEDWAGRLTSQGFRPTHAVSYMLLDAVPKKPLPRNDIGIARATTVDDATLFADIQSQGFIAEEDKDGDWWRDEFYRTAVANVSRPDQTFYICRLAGRPAAVAMVIRTDGVTGIYAVATRPDDRRKGLAGALLNTIWNDAASAARSVVALQAAEGSYAQDFYTRCGFREIFRSEVFERVV